MTITVINDTELNIVSTTEPSNLPRHDQNSSFSDNTYTLDMYSQTGSKDHLYRKTTCL